MLNDEYGCDGGAESGGGACCCPPWKKFAPDAAAPYCDGEYMVGACMGGFGGAPIPPAPGYDTDPGPGGGTEGGLYCEKDAFPLVLAPGKPMPTPDGGGGAPDP